MQQAYATPARLDALKIAGVVPKSTSVEVVINNATGKYYLPDSDILRGKNIVGLICQVQTQVGGADTVFTPSGRTVVDQQVLNDATLTLESDSLRVLDEHPLNHFVINNTGDRKYTALDGIRGFNPTKSYILIGNPAAPAGKLVTDEAFLLHFLYTD
jgi:hypothetical protein